MDVFPRLSAAKASIIALAALAISPLLHHIIFGSSENRAYGLTYILTYVYAAGVFFGVFTFWHLCRTRTTAATLGATVSCIGARRRYWSVAIAISAIAATVVSIAGEDGLNRQHAYWVKLVVKTDSTRPPQLRIRYGTGSNDLAQFQWQPFGQTILSMKRAPGECPTGPIRIDEITSDGKLMNMDAITVDGGVRQGSAINIAACNSMLRWPGVSRDVSLQVSGGGQRVRFYWLDQTKDTEAWPTPHTVSFELGGQYQGWALLPPQEIGSLSIESGAASPGMYLISGQVLAHPEQQMRLQITTPGQSRLTWPRFRRINVRHPLMLALGWICAFLAAMLAFSLLYRISGYVGLKRSHAGALGVPIQQLRRFGTIAGTIWMVCILCHLVFVFAVPIGFTNDSVGYYGMGRAFIDSLSLNDIVTVRTPGYPLFIAAVLRVFGDTAWGIALLQHLALASLSVVTLWCLWDKLPIRWAATAALLAGIAPALGAMANMLWTEALFSVLACSAVLFASCFDRGFIYVLLAGICAGAATMFRPNGLLLMVVIGAFLLLHFAWRRGERSIRPYLSAGALLIGGYLMLAVPWHLNLAVNRNTFVLGKGLKEFGAWAGYVFQDQLPVALPINRPDQAVYADPGAYRDDAYVAKAGFPLIFGNEIVYDRETEREWFASQSLAPYIENLKYYATLAWHPAHLRYEFKEIRWFLESWRQPSVKPPPSADELQRLVSTLTFEKPTRFEFLRKPCLALSQFVLDHWTYLAIGVAVGIIMSLAYTWLLPTSMFVAGSLLGFSTNLIPAERYVAVLEPIYYVLGTVGIYALWTIARRCFKLGSIERGQASNSKSQQPLAYMPSNVDEVSPVKSTFLGGQRGNSTLLSKGPIWNRAKVFRFGSSNWVLCLLLGLALLPGRFAWSPQTRTANWRGFDCSLFFLCILIPLTSALLERSEIARSWRCGILAGLTIFLTLPYHWLGLDRWFYYLNRPRWIDWKSLPQPPKLVWFPQAFRGPAQIPDEFWFFLFLAALLLGGGYLYARLRVRVGRPLRKSSVAFGAAIVILILIESWMHLSMRSPYTYICHFEQPAAAHYWYESLLFDNGQGAVNADYFVFRGLEEVFMGTPVPINGMLIRRSFPFYLSSQFSYFINPYYVMVFMNVVIWLAAVLAIRQYVAAHFDSKTAIIAALLTASGPGFIMYVAQPQTYLWGYCAVALIIWAHWRICGTPGARLRDYILFGAILSLALLTYDLLTILIYLVGYELLFKKSVRKIILSAAIAIAIYAAFGLLTEHMKSFLHDTRNVKDIGLSIANASAALRTNPLVLKSYTLYTGLFSHYVVNLSNSVFVFPLFVAAFGLFCLNSPHKLRLAGLLFLPSFASTTFLYLGQTPLAAFPRFSFIAYPAVYSLCGVGLWTVSYLAGRRRKYIASALAVCGIAAHIVLVNIDVFGYPWLYYLFYYEQLAMKNF